ncbi:serine/threonine protein kinase [Streptomyces sp. NBC_00878]|uniref:serine/threonine protein kinase n=1 Tax=Streptomyces sp. NBC_00878 TaxID=2975854 RepID=UPI00225AD3BC|nr:serine/threonine protein kinase [Streptomyces sp. NBC_00878]MCX4904536.1 serine/threonine protein kinase [Streptomyces sp. NBC_00878]
MTTTRRIGPYTVVTRLDADASGSTASGPTPVPERRFIARSADGDRTVLLSTPLPKADPRRFMREADASRFLLGPWVLPATEVAAPGGEAWHAGPYVPALPLPVALAVNGGPLPERTVRALAVALAETLAVLHGQELTHAGLCPAAVLLAADGPRLGCFGAVRAAAPDGAPRQDVPGLDAGSLAPEQAAGGQPSPLGDVYALGATLAYAATGSTTPEREEIPALLRSLVTWCLAREPAHRPQLSDIIALLAPDVPTAVPAGAGVGSRADSLLGVGWLPARIVAAVAHQSASVLAAEVQLPA